MIHLLGEERYSFKTDKGKIHVCRSDTTLTPFGGLVAFSSFLEKLGIIDTLVESCPIKRTSNNATPVRDILIGFLLVCIQSGKRFSHLRWVQDDPAIAEIFKVQRRIPSDSSVIRFFKAIDSEQGKSWLSKVEALLYSSINNHCILDWDSTVTTRFGEQEGAEVGYNPHKPGRPSHHPLLCTIAGTRVCLHMTYRAGNASSSSGWIEAMEEVLSRLPKGIKPFLNRADVAFASEESLSWHESDLERPHYLFKLRKTSRVSEAIGSVRETDWEGNGGFGITQVAECSVQLYGWSKKRRVVLSRKLIKKESPEESGTLFGICQYEYSAYVTNLPKTFATAMQIVILYNQRCDSENIFDETKNQWGLNGFCAQRENVTEFAARMNILSYNLWSIFVRFFNLTKHEEAQCSRKEFLFLASSLTRSGRETTLKLSVSNRMWKRIREGYDRLSYWLNQTAPQLKLIGGFGAWAHALNDSIGPPENKLLTVN
jgi:hypothetical protein